MLRVLIAAGLALIAGGALADEAWETDIGHVYYADEIGDTAIFAYSADKDQEGHFYFPGLAGNYENRGVHQGYWIEPGEGDCSATLTGIDGTTSTNWGRLTIAFHTPGWPTSWTLFRSDCFDDPDEAVNATSAY